MQARGEPHGLRQVVGTPRPGTPIHVAAALVMEQDMEVVADTVVHVSVGAHYSLAKRRH